MHILKKIIKKKQEEITLKKKAFPISEIIKDLKDKSLMSMKEAILATKSSGIIAEFKRKSPSKTNIFLDAKVESIIPKYLEANAAGISILTDQSFFGAKEEDFTKARAISSIPILRKDFIIDPYQIYESRWMGADVILLISAILTKDEVRLFTKIAHKLGLQCLFEIHNKEELKNYTDAIDIIGVNNRNLDNFITDYQCSIELYSSLPTSAVKISESGIHDQSTIDKLKKCGYDGFLIGEWFMKNHKKISL